MSNSIEIFIMYMCKLYMQPAEEKLYGSIYFYPRVDHPCNKTIGIFDRRLTNCIDLYLFIFNFLTLVSIYVFACLCVGEHMNKHVYVIMEKSSAPSSLERIQLKTFSWSASSSLERNQFETLFRSEVICPFLNERITMVHQCKWNIESL